MKQLHELPGLGKTGAQWHMGYNGTLSIKKIVGKSILIFYNQNLPIHAESIVEGEFSEYCQEAIKQYMYVYLTIIEMKIIAL